MSDDEDNSGAAKTNSEKHTTLELDIPPAAIADLIGSKLPDAPDEDKEGAAKSKATHDISLKVSDMTWGDFKSKLGDTSILSSAEVSFTPKEAKDAAHADLHADLIKQHWGSIFGLDATTDVSGGMSYTEGKGVGGDFKIEQDLKYKSIELNASVTTDFGAGEKPQVSAQVGLKIEF